MTRTPSPTSRPRSPIGGSPDPPPQVAGAGVAAASPPWPLAVGVLLVPEGVPAGVVAEQRLVLALGAYRFGLYLLDLAEVRAAAGSSSQRSGASGWAVVERLAARVVVDALVVRCHAGAVFPSRLPPVLAGLPLRLVRD